MTLSSIFTSIHPTKALVVGDFFLDLYTIGNAGRISPEAPVAVVGVKETEERPGGAGNVALNLISLGVQVKAIGRIGEDENGRKITSSLVSEGVGTDSFVVQENYFTPVKNRVIASNQQIVRIDYEKITPLPKDLEKRVIQSLDELLQDIDVVAISDYGKGFLQPDLLSALISKANENNIPVITDPKGTDFSKYEGSSLLKPNLSEALAVSGLDSNADLEFIAKRVLQLSGAKEVLITRSEEGMTYFSSDFVRQDFPADIRKVKDVTGAGDTVLAALAFAVANRLSIEIGCTLANIAAGLAVEVVGCGRITLKEIAKRLLEDKVENKVFDEDHLYTLQQVLKDETTTILGLTEDPIVSLSLFEAVQKISSEENPLVVYLRDQNPNEVLIGLLTSLKDVDYLVCHGESFCKLCDLLQPDKVFVYDKNGLKKIEEEVISSLR